MAHLRGAVVIPAHNEAVMIETCLEPIRSLVYDGLVEVVVVSNGSADDTAARAAAVLDGLRGAHVVNLAQPSKPGALREGDRHVQAYPRIYLDADVRISADTLITLLDALAERRHPAVGAPTLRVDTSASPWVVRAYHRVWARLPYVTDGVVGTGVYAVNAAGGSRMGPFPDVTNDDEWVRRHFAPDEFVQSSGDFTVAAPRSTRALVRQKARTELGNMELDSVVKGGRGRSTTWASLRSATGSTAAGVVEVTAYLGVTAAARAVARWRRWRGTTKTWATDTTSRVAEKTSAQVGR